MASRNTQEEAREAMVQHRQQEEHLQQSMLSRSEAEINTPVEPEIQQEARELMTEHRQQEEHLQESMLNRSVAQVGIPVEANNSSQEQ
jgi:hypothetical protein